MMYVLSRFFRFWSNTKSETPEAHEEQLPDNSEDVDESSLLGTLGFTISNIDNHRQGIVSINGQNYEAVSAYGPISSGKQIEVLYVRPNHILVVIKSKPENMLHSA